MKSHTSAPNRQEHYVDSPLRAKLLQEILEDIRNTIKSGASQHFVLLGARGMGKTSLLWHLHNELKKEPKALPTFIAGNLIHNSAAFFQDLVDGVAEAYSKKFGNLRKEMLMSETAVKMDIEKSRNWRAFAGKTRKIVQDFAEKEDAKVILLIDDFDEMLHNLENDFQSYLRNFLSETQYLLLVASVTSIDFLAHSKDPFFQFFRIVTIDKLGQDDIGALLDEILSKSDVSIDKEAISRIQEIANGYPRLLMLLLKESLYQATIAGNKVIKKDHVERALQSSLDSLSNDFLILFGQMPSTQQEILFAMIEGAKTPKEIQEATGLPSGSITPSLVRFMEKGDYVVRVRRGEYRLKDSLFAKAMGSYLKKRKQHY